MLSAIDEIKTPQSEEQWPKSCMAYESTEHLLSDTSIGNDDCLRLIENAKCAKLASFQNSHEVKSICEFIEFI